MRRRALVPISRGSSASASSCDIVVFVVLQEKRKKKKDNLKTQVENKKQA
jgi:hypothetical protein